MGPIRGFSLIFSNIDIEHEHLPYRVSDTLSIREATEDEIVSFREHLERSSDPMTVAMLKGKDNECYVYRSWYAVDFQGSNGQIYDLEKLSVLVNPKLRFGTTFFFDENGESSGVLWGGDTCINHLLSQARAEKQKLELEELNQLKYYNQLMNDASEEFEYVSYVIDLYQSSLKLEQHSRLLLLSHFSIIESLVAHKPRLSESLDSITHQIKNKLNLLSKRFVNHIDHTNFFGDISIQTLWTKLYQLRSDIAHGQSYSFDSKNQSLKSLQNVNCFLDQTVCELIRLAVIERDLIPDLREC